MQRVTRRNGSVQIQDITAALVESGYTSLDQQAKALGLRRSTTWTIIRTKHKLGRLSAKTITRILENPETPTSVRAIVEQYLDERPGAVRSQRVSKPFDKTDRTG